MNLTELRSQWKTKVIEVLEKAGLEEPSDRWMQGGGKEGIHTEHIGYILAEMQYLQRAYPGLNW